MFLSQSFADVCAYADGSGGCPSLSSGAMFLVAPLSAALIAWLWWAPAAELVQALLAAPGEHGCALRRLLRRLHGRRRCSSNPSDFVWQLVAMQHSRATEESQWGVCRAQLRTWLLCVQRLRILRDKCDTLRATRGADVKTRPLRPPPVLPEGAKGRIEAFIGPGWQCGAVTASYARAVARAAELRAEADAQVARARAMRQVDAVVAAIVREIIDPQVLDAARKGMHQCDCVVNTTYLSSESIAALAAATAGASVLGKAGVAQVLREHLTSSGFRVTLREFRCGVPGGGGTNSGNTSVAGRLAQRCSCARRRAGGHEYHTQLCEQERLGWSEWLREVPGQWQWLGHLLGRYDRMPLSKLKIFLRW